MTSLLFLVSRCCSSRASKLCRSEAASFHAAPLSCAAPLSSAAAALISPSPSLPLSSPFTNSCSPHQTVYQVPHPTSVYQVPHPTSVYQVPHPTSVNQVPHPTSSPSSRLLAVNPILSSLSSRSFSTTETRAARSFLVDASEPLQRFIPRELSQSALEESLQDEDYFNVRSLVDMKELFEAGVHYGHKEGMGWDAMAEFLLGHRFGVCVFDLNHTVVLLQDALNFMAHVAYRGGVILFVSNHRETLHQVESAAMSCGEYAHTKEWETELLTNSETFFGDVTRLPDLCILMNTKTTVFEDHLAIRDCAKMLIPTVGVCDSDADPRLVTYPIPGNDDSPSSVLLFLRLFKAAILRGKTKRATVLMTEEQQNEESDGDDDQGAHVAESLPIRSRNEERIRQISALHAATLRESELLEMQREATGRKGEFEEEDNKEAEKIGKEISRKVKAAKKKAKRAK